MNITWWFEIFEESKKAQNCTTPCPGFHVVVVTLYVVNSESLSAVLRKPDYVEPVFIWWRLTRFIRYRLWKKYQSARHTQKLRLILTLKEPEYLVNLKAGGGTESARGGFRAPVWSISMQTIHKRVSNESWHLYLHVESLNTILSCIVLP